MEEGVYSGAVRCYIHDEHFACKHSTPGPQIEFVLITLVPTSSSTILIIQTAAILRLIRATPASTPHQPQRHKIKASHHALTATTRYILPLQARTASMLKIYDV
jgi:hypothetical protein